MDPATWHEEQQRVAVVVAHGIGNHLPMDTVRSMVDTVFGADSGLDDAATVYSRLDRDAEFLDLRRLMLTPTDQRPRVDFYELYWQPTFGHGTPGSAAAWACRLLLRGRYVGGQMRRVVWTVRAALLLLVLIVAAVSWALRAVGPEAGWQSFVAPALPVVALVLVLPKLLIRNVLSTVVADASRWFAPGPQDIESRDKVRHQAVGLLKELHRPQKDGRPRYGRIIVVAHSLGSVVAYDAIRLAFDELRDPPDLLLLQPGPTDTHQPLAWSFASHRPGEPSILGPDGRPLLKQTSGTAYHAVQAALHGEQRSLGVPWRVTDFITVGSPLTHARDLMASRDVSLERRMEETEYPSCPPRGAQQNSELKRAERGEAVPLSAGREGTGRLAFYRKRSDGPLLAHEASPFATTRWTNMYVPMTPWLGGDPVGGPAAPVFGRGVVDVPVEISAPSKTRRTVMALPVGAHTWYWRRVGTGSGHPERDCVEQLRKAMDLRWA